MTKHKQVAFRLADNTHTEVDEGLYEFLCLLRDLGVQTQYSCQGTNQKSAYVLADGESFVPVLGRLILMTSKHYVLRKIFEKPAIETYFEHPEVPVPIVERVGPYVWYRWEIDHYPNGRDRHILRWKPKATPLFVEALQELINQPKESSHV